MKHDTIDILVPLLVSDDRRRGHLWAVLTNAVWTFDNEHLLKAQTHTGGSERQLLEYTVYPPLSLFHLCGCVFLLDYV